MKKALRLEAVKSTIEEMVSDVICEYSYDNKKLVVLEPDSTSDDENYQLVSAYVVMTIATVFRLKSHVTFGPPPTDAPGNVNENLFVLIQ